MRHSILPALILMLSAGAFGQAANDSPLTAIYIGEGMPTAGTNAAATTGPDPIGPCPQMSGDVWYLIVPACTGTETVKTCHAGTTFDTVIVAWDATNGIGALVPLACNDDSCGSLSSSVSFPVTVGSYYYISVGGYYGATGNFVLSASPGSGAGMNLSFSTFGPGTIGFAINSAPALGTVITIVTTNQGAYPNGWFFGIDVQPFELQFSLGSGYPLTASLDQCGSFAFGPVGGAPSGIAVYAVSFGFPVGAPVPNLISAPAFITIP